MSVATRRIIVEDCLKSVRASSRALSLSKVLSSAERMVIVETSSSSKRRHRRERLHRRGHLYRRIFHYLFITGDFSHFVNNADA